MEYTQEEVDSPSFSVFAKLYDVSIQCHPDIYKGGW